MAIGDIVRVEAKFTGPQGQTWMWVWHYVVETAAAFLWGQILTAVTTALGSAWAEIATWIDSSVEGDSVNLLLWDSVNEEFNGVINGTISTLVGTSSAEGSPGNVAPYVTFFTSLPKSRGKKFFFGVSEAVANDGVVQSGPAGDFADFGNTLNDPVIGGGNTLTPGNFRPSSQLFFRWNNTTVGVGAFTGSQYRRLPGRGI